MAYPGRWSLALSAVRGDKVPLSEELVPTTSSGHLDPPKDDVLINLDINYLNGKLSSRRNGKYLLRKPPSYDRRL